jgi:hypothetical protein
MIPSILSRQLVVGVKDFLTTTFHSTTPAFAGVVERFVDEEGNLFKGPYVSLALPFCKGESDERFFPEILDESFVPYHHQELAFRRLGKERPEPTLVATGTGSGKLPGARPAGGRLCRSALPAGARNPDGRGDGERAGAALRGRDLGEKDVDDIGGWGNVFMVAGLVSFPSLNRY